MIEALEQLFAFLESIGYFYESSQINAIFNARIKFINDLEKLESMESALKELKDLIPLADQKIQDLLSDSTAHENNFESIVNEIIGSSILKSYCNNHPTIIVKKVSCPKNSLVNWISLKEGFSPSFSKYNKKTNLVEIYLLSEFFDSITDQEIKESITKIAIARELSRVLLNSNYFTSTAMSQILIGLNLINVEKTNKSTEEKTDIILSTGINLILLNMYTLIMDICAVELVKNKKAFFDYLDHLATFIKDLDLDEDLLSELMNRFSSKDLVQASFPEMLCLSNNDLNC